MTTHNHTTDEIVPRCRHGAILLGCADESCPEQNAYLAAQEAALELFHASMRANARAALGLGSSASER